MCLGVLADDGGRQIVNMLNVFEVVPDNFVRIISNVTLFFLGSCLHDNSSLWITPIPPRPEARGAFTNEYPLGVIAAIYLYIYHRLDQRRFD